MSVIGIIGAMPSELSYLRTVLSDAVCTQKAGYDFYTTDQNGNRLIYVCCGIGRANAAICTQVLISEFHVDLILNTGIAGGMRSDIGVCDIVISDEVLYHDLDLHFLKDYPPYCDMFQADPNLIACAKAVCEAEKIPCFTGRIVSGEAFISDNAVKSEIQARFSPCAVDMETAAIGHCAYRNQIPFVSVRCISDNADDEGAMSFDTFEVIAAERVAKIVLAMAKAL